MSWTLDVESQSLYVTLSDDAVAGQVEMPDGTIVDTDEAGRAVGIEVLRAGTPWDHQAVAQRFHLSKDAAEYLGLLSRTVAMIHPHRRAQEAARALISDLIRGEQLASTSTASTSYMRDLAATA